MTRQLMLNTVKNAYAAFGKRDIDALCRLATADCIFQSPGLPEFMPWAKVHRGHAGIAHFVESLDEDLNFEHFAPVDFIVDEANGSVVALGHARCTYRSTQRSYTNEWAHLFRLVDGKIVHFQEFPDTAAQLVAVHPAFSLPKAPEEQQTANTRP